MTAIGFISAKHSPGATTAMLAIGLASAETRPTIAIEADPAGGDLAAMCRLTLERGLLSATATTRDGTDPDLTDHLQNHGGLSIVVGPTAPQQMANALRATGLAVLKVTKATFDITLVDFGRLDTATSTTVPAMLAACDQIVVVTRPTLASVEHIRSRMSVITAHPKTSLLVIGSLPYAPQEAAEATGLDLMGRLPFTERDVELVTQNPTTKAARRCALIQAATSITNDLADKIDRAPQTSHQTRVAS